jgi:hypothetical protein
MRDYQYDHVHLRSPDPEVTARFFETMFGAEVTAMDDLPGWVVTNRGTGRCIGGRGAGTSGWTLRAVRSSFRTNRGRQHARQPPRDNHGDYSACSDQYPWRCKLPRL